MKFKLNLLQIKCHVLDFTQDKVQNGASKDNQSFLQKRSSLTIGTHSSPLKRVGLLRRPTPTSPSRKLIPHRSGSPTAIPRRRRRKEEDPHLHTDK
jgi:hypothetical protein